MGLGRILRPGRGQAGDARHRLYYAADIHGTESLWRKFLVAPRYYRADVLIMGGDVTGKVVIPVVEDGDGFIATRFGRQERARTEDELAVLERRIRDNGMYPYRTTSDEVERIAGLTVAGAGGVLRAGDAGDVRPVARCGRRAAARHRRPLLRHGGQRRPAADRGRDPQRQARPAVRRGHRRVRLLHDDLRRAFRTGHPGTPAGSWRKTSCTGGSARSPTRSPTSAGASSTCTSRRMTPSSTSPPSWTASSTRSGSAASRS